MKRRNDFALSLAVSQAAPKRKPRLNPAEYARRFAREKALQQRRYCDALALWQICHHKSCHRHRACGGDHNACLKRALDRVPHQRQWQARQDILETTPHHIGGPERQARQCMPRDFYGSEGG
jgi:hypothetical protein